MTSDELFKYAEEIEFNLNEAQKEIIKKLDISNWEDDYLPRCSGKTTLGLFIASYFLTRIQNSRTIILVNKYDHINYMQDTLFRDFLSGELGIKKNKTEINNELTDSCVSFIKADSDSMRGRRVNFVFLDEVFLNIEIKSKIIPLIAHDEDARYLSLKTR